jgi:hypothetical protein
MIIASLTIFPRRQYFVLIYTYGEASMLHKLSEGVVVEAFDYELSILGDPLILIISTPRRIVPEHCVALGK